MKRARILHNPNAGESEYSRKRLLSMIQAAGFSCSYSSTKEEGWGDFEPDDELIVLAGGDGTVRKVAGTLIEKHLPIGLLPLGTANNIARSLGIGNDVEEIIRSWSRGHIKRYDVGRIYGLKRADFFLEGFGFGVFPRLMKKMAEKRSGSIEKNLKMALELLHEIILTSKARYCEISVDGADYSGEFLLAEVMNSQSIGPNLNLAPFADPGDGALDVILISDRQRDEFASYVHHKLHNVEQAPVFNILKAKNLEISWAGKLLHVDDEIIQLDKSKPIKIRLQEGVLRFLVPSVNERLGSRALAQSKSS